ncbi:MAG: hypothetical protein M3Q56_09660 [Bacteroidota bacterium]|nr:hypothetical protein [Bacteroidota bacterium]
MKKLNGSGQSTLLWHVAEIKITYHNQTRISNSLKFAFSSDAEKVFCSNWSDDMELVEVANALFLNKENFVKGIFRISRGGITGFQIWDQQS